MAAPMKRRLDVILAKLEATYATDPTPDGADAILTKNLTVTPYVAPAASRNVDRQKLGSREMLSPTKAARVQFTVELTGSGELGVAPAFGALLGAAGHSETVVATTSVEYEPTDAYTNSLAIYYMEDGVLQKILGCRPESMTIGFDATADGEGRIPVITFTFLGLYQRPTADGSPVTADTSGWGSPRAVNEANTAFTLGGETLVLRSLNFDYGLSAAHHDVPNRDEVIVSDRRITGQLIVEATKPGDYDLFADLESHSGVTTLALELVHGASPSQITVAAPEVQMHNLQNGEAEGIKTRQVDLQVINGDSGELSLLFD